MKLTSGQYVAENAAYEAAFHHPAKSPGDYPVAWDRIARAVEKAVIRRILKDHLETKKGGGV